MSTHTPPSKKESGEGIPENDSHTSGGIKTLGESSACSETERSAACLL